MKFSVIFDFNVNVPDPDVMFNAVFDSRNELVNINVVPAGDSRVARGIEISSVFSDIRTCEVYCLRDSEDPFAPSLIADSTLRSPRKFQDDSGVIFFLGQFIIS